MDTDKERARRLPPPKLLLLFVLICAQWFLPPRIAAQEGDQEVIAHRATGRVVLAVASDGIVIGAVERRMEPEARLPVIVPLGGRRVGVLLGAVEWTSSVSSAAPVRLDRELPTLVSEAARPRPANDPYPAASDIESIGVALLERLRTATSEIHRKLDMKPEEPLTELLLVDYMEGYGPEIWLLRYRIAQDAFRGDYWRTRMLRPSYTQLYPPEKGQPHTLIEVRYPDDAAPTLLDLLRQNDPRLARLGEADSATAHALERLTHGESHKAHAGDVAQCLRAALDAVAGTQAKETLGVLYEQRGFEWVLAPPERPEKAKEGKPREPGAPTLRKP